MAIGSDLIFSDDFNRADGSLGADWTNVDGDNRIESNAASPQTNATLQVSHIDPALLGSADYKVDLQISTHDRVGCIVRGSGGSGNVSGYVLGRSAGNVYIGKMTNGTLTQLGVVYINQFGTSVYTCEVENSGNDVVLRVREGGSLRITHTDINPGSTYTDAGYTGLFSDANSQTVIWDDFSVTGTAAASFAIDSAPTTYREGEQFSITVSNPATVPTVNNTTIEFI